jgi:hypothetical protein
MRPIRTPTVHSHCPRHDPVTPQLDFVLMMILEVLRIGRCRNFKVPFFQIYSTTVTSSPESMTRAVANRSDRSTSHLAIRAEWPPRQNSLASPPFGDATGQQYGHNSKGSISSGLARVPCGAAIGFGAAKVEDSANLEHSISASI